MREILFRGKRNDKDEWQQGDLYQYGALRVIGVRSDDGRITTYPVIPDTVGQYSGLQDMNGNRIYEGDILSGLFLFGKMVDGVCEFRDGSFGVKWMRGDTEEFHPFTGTCNITWEIIGNIHDNPKMLKEAKLK